MKNTNILISLISLISAVLFLLGSTPIALVLGGIALVITVIQAVNENGVDLSLPEINFEPGRQLETY
jgi:uncharacterized membrane protein AbrB (regulator of aidB expression)